MTERTMGIMSICQNSGDHLNPRSSLVDAFVHSNGIVDRFRLRSSLRSFLREEKFTRWFPLNRHTKDGVTVTYGTYLLGEFGSFGFEVKIKIESPTGKSDKLVNKIQDVLRIADSN
ncbi:MAG: hypothetical protein ABR981_00550 [Candidatus Micrarchaeaceae archaeon]|jgi:hypothetical protein